MFAVPGLLLSLSFVLVHSCSWNNCPKYSDDSKVMNVHLIAHTHDDLGWLKTVDDYFTGRNKQIVNVGVEYIYSSVIQELDKDPTKRFSFAGRIGSTSTTNYVKGLEVGYLTRWLEGRPADGDQVKLLKKLVRNGQLEFIGGGWVQPDEATAHYIDIIDQYTLGLHKLLTNFDQCGIPKVAWQIDPFGHSREHANLVTMMGHEALFHSRIHYSDLIERKKSKNLEYIWNTSDDLKTNLFAGAFYTNIYDTPPGYCFDIRCLDDPIVDDPKLEGYNAPEKAAKFIEILKNYTAVHRHNHYLLSMGSDFHFSDAILTFTSLDRLIKAVNKKTSKTGIRVFYSTPACYVAASLNGKNPPRLETKNDDFFPYASGNHSYWTGYFTSKPTIKRMIRESSNLLRLSRAMRVMSNLTGDQFEKAEEKLEKAVALCQHHDAVTGTSKENVTIDYERRLQNGVNAVQKNLAKSLQLMQNEPAVYFDFCDRWSESVCPVIGNNSPLAVTVFNSNSRLLNTTLRLPFYGDSAIVQDDKLQQINSEIVKHFHPPAQLPTELHTAPFELTFPASLPPLGFQTFFVTRLHSRLARPPLQNRVLNADDEPASIENSVVRLDFDKNGVLSKWTDKTEKKTFEFQQGFYYYTGWSKEDQPSGAYVFRPQQLEPLPLGHPTRVTVVKSKSWSEVRQIISPWISQRIRIEQNSPWVTFEFLVGPIPKEKKDPIGKEVITRYNVTELKSAGEFFTDSNGRQLMKRHINKSFEFQLEPVSSNFYPVTSTILVRDETHQLTVLTDRSEGGGSFGDGNIDLMGVDEALDEPGKDGRGLIVNGKHLVRLGPRNTDYRSKAIEVYNEPVFAFSPIKDAELFVTDRTTSFRGLLTSLPPEVQVLTLKSMPDGRVLLRLEHILQVSEGGFATDVDLMRLFAKLNLVAADEMNLAANRKLRRLQLEKERIVRLQPMDIRTFLVTISA